LRRERRGSRRAGGLSTSRTLAKNSIAITRPVGQGEETSMFVRKLGWNPFIVHAVELKPLARSSILKEFSRVIGEGPIDLLVFMSSTGVDAFFDMLKPHSNGLPGGAGQPRVIAVGPMTSEALVRHGVQGAVVPKKYSSGGILDYFSKFELKGRRVVLIRSSAADDHLSVSLTLRGAFVETITVYRSTVPGNVESVLDFLAGLEKGQFQAVLFTSAASASNLFSIAELENPRSHLIRLMNSTLVGAIGPATGERLRELGLDPTMPGRYLIEDAIEELVRKAEECPIESPRAFS
jgi:uroporphyrinogen-III synthase